MFFTSSLIDHIQNRNTNDALSMIAALQDINSKTYWDQLTPLHFAVQTEQQKILVALIAANADINAKSYSNWVTPLHQAAIGNNADASIALIAAKPELNAKTYKEQNTALHIVTQHGDVKHLNIYLQAGASYDMQNAEGDSPLHIAARNNHYKAIELLLLHGANCNIMNKNGETPLSISMINKNETCANMLINYGAKIDQAFTSIVNSNEQLKNDLKQANNKLNELQLANVALAIEMNYWKNKFNNLPQAEAVNDSRLRPDR